MRIALDTASGLSYLHNTCRIVHADLKSPNILLQDWGSGLRAKIGDVGAQPYDLWEPSHGHHRHPLHLQLGQPGADRQQAADLRLRCLLLRGTCPRIMLALLTELCSNNMSAEVRFFEKGSSSC